MHNSSRNSLCVCTILTLNRRIAHLARLLALPNRHRPWRRSPRDFPRLLRRPQKALYFTATSFLLRWGWQLLPPRSPPDCGGLHRIGRSVPLPWACISWFLVGAPPPERLRSTAGTLFLSQAKNKCRAAFGQAALAPVPDSKFRSPCFPALVPYAGCCCSNVRTLTSMRIISTTTTRARSSKLPHSASR